MNINFDNTMKFGIILLIVGITWLITIIINFTKGKSFNFFAFKIAQYEYTDKHNEIGGLWFCSRENWPLLFWLNIVLQLVSVLSLIKFGIQFIMI